MSRPVTPTGPTGPGRTHTPGPADAAFRPSDGPGASPLADLDAELELHHAGIGEPHEHSAPAVVEPPCTCGHDRVERLFHIAPCPKSERGARLPRRDEQIRDGLRLLAQLLAVLGGEVDPDSEPAVMAWPALDESILVHRLLLTGAVEQLRLVQRRLEKIAKLPQPAAGPEQRAS